MTTKAIFIAIILICYNIQNFAEGRIMLNIISQETTIQQYDKFEVIIETDAKYKNPFSPEDVDLQLHITTPSGKIHIMPAFYDEENKRPLWKVRWTPMEVGNYRYYATLGDAKTDEYTFECVPGDLNGFIRLSPKDYRYFQFDSGKPFFIVGQNVCWTDDYEHYFKKMAENGENFTRIWMIHWNIALEWTGNDYPGLGKYNLKKAKWIDEILDLAEKYGIYIMLCFDSFNTLRIRDPYPAYEGNPYSKENGGMLERPDQFFTNPEARSLFKQRLRYLVARYAYSPYIFSWEFWNEVDIIEKYISDEVVDWHREMAQYLRKIDPMRHLISTSFAGTAGDSAIWKLPEMEYTQNHQYGSKDMAESISHWTKRNLNEFHKPQIFGEFGTDAGGPSPNDDPDGINLHNGIWSSVMSGSAGTAMLWWWDNYIDPKNLYYHFQPLSQFVKDVDWINAGFRDVSIDIEKSSLRAYGLQSDTTALIWFQNSQHTWHKMLNKEPLEATKSTIASIQGLKDGTYQIEWWNTYEPDNIERLEAICKNGVLRLEIPTILKDIACKVRKYSH
jgi:hypothetical protein